MNTNSINTNQIKWENSFPSIQKIENASISIESNNIEESCLSDPVSPPIIFSDQSPKTRLSTILKKHGLINDNYQVMKNLNLNFTLDSSQEKLIKNILETAIKFNYRTRKNGPVNQSCEFSIEELLSYITEQASLHGNMQVNLVGGIVRRLFTLSEVSCHTLFEKCKIPPLPKDLINKLLEEKKRDIPDMDIRFDFKLQNESSYETLEKSRRFPINFICSKLSRNDITAEKIIDCSLNKWFLRDFRNDKYSTVNFSGTKFSFSETPSSLECLFICNLAARYLSSRDNLTLNITPVFKDEKPSLKFDSVNDKQLEAILHILLGKISLEHEIDASGFIRVISLFTEGETLTNPLSELDIHAKNFLGTKDSQSLEYYFFENIQRCLKNHYPNYLKDPLLLDALIYNLASIFSNNRTEIYIAWKSLNPSSSLFFDLLCKKAISFQELEAACGLAALMNMASTNMNNPNPTALLCTHGGRVFIQFKLPKTAHHILIPFEPENFTKTLQSSRISELSELVKKLCAKKEPIKETSLLNLYHICNDNLFKDTFDDLKISETEYLVKSLKLPSFLIEEFTDKTLEADNSQERLFWYKVLLQQTENSPLGKKIKEWSSFQEIVNQEPFEKDLFIKEWISLLTESNEEGLQKHAFSLLEKNKKIASKLLQNDFTLDWIKRLIKIEGCVPLMQKLMIMLQNRHNDKRIAPEIELKLITNLLRNRDPFLEKETLAACKIIENYFIKNEEKPKISTEIFDFIHKLPKEFLEQKEKLLIFATEKDSIIEKETIQKAWLEILSMKISDLKTPGTKVTELWSKATKLNVWNGLESSEEYQEALLSLSERLKSEKSTKGFEFLELLISFSPQKKPFENRIKTIFSYYITSLIKGEHKTENPLELAIKRLKKYRSLLSQEQRFKHFLDILKIQTDQKKWKEAEELCDKLLSNPLAKKYSLLLTSAFEQILQATRKKVSETKIIHNKNFNLCIENLNILWQKKPLEALNVAKSCKYCSEEHKISLLKTAIISLEKIENIETLKTVLFDPFVQERKTAIDCSKLAKILLKKLEKSPQKDIIDSFKLFDAYLDHDLDSWSSCLLGMSYHEDTEQVINFFKKGITLIKDPKTICDCYVKLFELLTKKKTTDALEIIHLFSKKQSAFYNVWLKVDKKLQAQILNLFIQAEIQMDPRESLCSSKSHLLSFYETLQSLKTKEDPHLLPSEQVLVKQLLRSNSIDDQQKGLELVSKKLKFLSKTQSLKSIKQLVLFTIKNTFFDEYLENSIKQMDNLCEFAYSFQTTDPSFSLRAAKMLAKHTLPSISLKTNFFIKEMLCKKNQEKEFWEPLETYLFAQLDHSKHLVDVENLLQILHSRQLADFCKKNNISTDRVQKLWIKYDETLLKYKNDITERTKRYLRLWFSTINSIEDSSIWSQKILNLLETSSEKPLQNEKLSNFLKVFCYEVAMKTVALLPQDPKAKSMKTLPKAVSEEISYCRFLNALLLKVFENQESDFSFITHRLVQICIEKISQILKVRALPPHEEQLFSQMLLEYVFRSDLEKVEKVSQIIQELDIPKNHKEIFIPLVHKLLNSKDVNDQTKAIILMRSFIYKNKDDGQALNELFDKIIHMSIEGFDKMDPEKSKLFFAHVEYTTLIQRLFHSEAPETHKNFLQEKCFQYVEKISLLEQKCTQMINLHDVDSTENAKKINLLFIAFKSLEYLGRTISNSDQSELKRFLEIASVLFSCLKSNKELLVKGTDLIKRVNSVGLVLEGIASACHRENDLIIEPITIKQLIIDIRNWIKFIASLKDMNSIHNYGEFHELLLKGIIDAFPENIKKELLEYLKDK